MFEHLNIHVIRDQPDSIQVDMNGGRIKVYGDLHKPKAFSTKIAAAKRLMREAKKGVK